MKGHNVKTILLRSGWQAVNIGDIGHTPGALELLRRHLPDARVILWPNNLDLGAESMLRREFPEVRVVWGRLDAQGRPSSQEVLEAFEEADFFLHGSAPSLVSQAHLQAWKDMTGKPYGILGITIQEVDEAQRKLLSGSRFLFTRDTKSLAVLRNAGVSVPVLDFAPDATFAIALRDDPAALRFLASTGLETGRFACLVTRLRFTPYHRIHRDNGWSAEKIRSVEAVNELHREADHAKLRQVIVRWVRETGHKVLLCPEMTYQTEILRPMLYDPLPADVKDRVALRETYWLPDEAGSVYQRASAVVSAECHSPIIASAMGTPGMYVRQPQDTIKGQMWRDVGLGDWTFEIEEADGDAIADRLLTVRADRRAALDRLGEAMTYVRGRFAFAMETLRDALGS